MVHPPAEAAALPAAVAPAAPPSLYRLARIVLALVPLVGVHLALVGLFFVPVTWTAVILFIVVTRISGTGITVGFHRYLAHHAFKTSRWFQFALTAAGCVAMQKGPLWWCVFHREHHKHSDEPGDVHSPVLDGFWYAHFGWLVTQDLSQPNHDNVRDLARFPELVWLDRLWMVPGILVATACYLIDGRSGLLWGFCLGTAVVFQVTFLVNSAGHLWGSQRFDTGDGSRNNFVIGVLAMGEGWHNNHHRAPTSARHGFAKYEVDLAYLIIKTFRALGLVWGVRQPPEAAMDAARGARAAA